MTVEALTQELNGFTEDTVSLIRHDGVEQVWRLTSLALLNFRKFSSEGITFLEKLMARLCSFFVCIGNIFKCNYKSLPDRVRSNLFCAEDSDHEPQCNTSSRICKINTVKKLFYDDHGNYPTRRVTVVSIQIEVVFDTHGKSFRYTSKVDSIQTEVISIQPLFT